MKKSRLLSLLLSVIMIVSSLPIVATSVSAAEPQKVQAGVELLTGTEDASNWVGELQAANKSHGTHLRWQTYFSPTTSDLVIKNITAPAAATDYYVKLVVRSQAASGSHGWRTQNGAGQNVNFVVGSAFTGNGVNMTGINSGDNTATIVVKMAMAAGATSCTVRIRGDNTYYNFVPKEIYSVGVYSDAACTNSVWTSTITDTGIGANLEWKNNSAAVVNARSFMRVPAIALVNNAPTQTNYNSAAVFNTGKILTPGTYELTFDARQTYFFRESDHNTVEYEYEYQKLLGSKTRAEVVPVKGVRELEKDNGARAVITEAHLNKIDVVNKTYNGSKDNVNIDTDISTNLGSSDASYPVLMTGDTGLSTKLYHVLYKQQYGYRNYNNNTSYPEVNGVRVARSFFAFDSIHTYFHENYRDVKVVLKSGSDTIKSSNVRIDDKWATKKITFTVSENTSLSNIYFGGTGKAYDNDAFDIDNLSLKMVEPVYSVSNNAIESGLLTTATRGNATVVDAKADYSDVTTVPGDYAKNGYISAGDLPWYYGGSNWVTAANVLFKQDVSEKYTEGKQYVVTFRARKAATTAGAVKITASFWGQGAGTTLTLTDEWQEYKGSKVATAKMNNQGLNFSIHLADGSYAPVDIDDLTIWKDNNENKIYDSGDVLLYSENYNNPSKKYIGTSWNVNEIDAVFLSKVNSAYPNANNSVGAVGISDRRHTNITHEFEETYASGALEYTGLNVASGVFSFTADIKLPYHYHYNMNSLTSSDKAAAETYYNLNYHEANLVFTMKKGSETKTETVSLGKKALSSSWNTVSAYVILEDGYTVTGIKVVPVISKLNNAEVVPAANQVLNFKNVGLVRHGGLSVKNDPIETGLLASATKNYTETVDSGYDLDNYDANNYAEKNGYITSGRQPFWFRTAQGGKPNTTGAAGWASNMWHFTLKLNEDIKPNAKYGVSVDVRESVPDNQTGTKVKFDIANCNPAQSSSFFVLDDEGAVNGVFKTYSWTTTAKADASGALTVSVRHGDNAINSPVDFDNLTVWEDTNGNAKYDAGEREIYSEDFNDVDGAYIGGNRGQLNTYIQNGVSKFDLGSLTLTHNFEENYAKVSGADCALVYSGLSGNPGVYTFSAKMQIPYHYYEEVRNESDHGPAGRYWTKGDGNGEAIFAANEHNVEVKFTLTPDDASAPVKYKTTTAVVTNAWDDVAASVVIDEGYTLTAVTITPTVKDLAKNAWGANNVTLNFKKVNLVRLGGYVPFNGTITNGELLTGADYNYTDVETEYDFNTENFEDGKAVKNGYISVGPMPWVYNGTKWVANDILLFKQNSPLLYTVGNRYAVSFSARKGVDTDETVKLQARFYGSNVGMPEITLTNEWQNYVGVWTNDVAGSAGKDINFSININGGKAVDTPVDIDNLVIWEDLNGNMICDPGEKIAYSENYNTDGDYVGLSTVNSYICSKFYDKIGGSWPTEANSVGASIIVKNERYYDNFTHLYEDNYAYGDLEYTNIKNAGEGVYTFTAEVELPYHYHYAMASLTSSDKAIAQKYYDLNTHDVKVTFTIDTDAGEETKVITLDNAVEFGWNTIAASVVIAEGQSLKAVKAELVSNKLDDGTDVVPADKQVLNFRNAWLTSEALPVVEAEADDDDNYLDGIKPQYNDNTIPKEVVENDPDGYLYVGERNDSAAQNYEIFRINTGAKLKAGTTYYVEYDLKCALATRIRVTVDVSTESETVLDGSGASKTSPSTFIVSDSNSGFKTVYFMNTSGVEWLHSDVPAGTNYTFKGHFTPTADSNGLVIKFNRGDHAPSCKGALELDNFRVYYIENGKQIDVYTNNLNKEGDIADFVGNAYAGTGFEFKQILPVSHTLYTPVDADEVMSITYNLGLSVDESVEGKYSFMTVVKLAEATDKKAGARVYFNYSDGTFDIDYLEITKDWGYIGKSGWLERYPELESITIEFYSDVPVMLMKPELNIFYKYTYGKPNSGIVMVLIKKMQGKMIDPWKSVGVN